MAVTSAIAVMQGGTSLGPVDLAVYRLHGSCAWALVLPQRKSLNGGKFGPFIAMLLQCLALKSAQ